MARASAVAVFVPAPWRVCLLLALSNAAKSFSVGCSKCSCISRYDQKLHSIINCDDHERRSFLKKSASLAGIVAGSPADAVGEESAAGAASSAGDFDCLVDLPPITPGCARLYLCRHGQTENNRLRLVQGARVDPPINENGRDQARRLGTAVSRLAGPGRGTAPALVAHSRLRRARETAVALAEAASTAGGKGAAPRIYGEVRSLGEIDFGSLEGTDVGRSRTAMAGTLASWAMGDIDRRNEGGGESGREVLERAALSLEELGNIATSPSSTSSSMLAVSHSAYLRVLLSLANDTPLVESALWKIQNGSVNIVDLNVEGRKRLVTSSSRLFGGEIVGALRGDKGLKLEIPEAHLIRRNEVRHLGEMSL